MIFLRGGWMNNFGKGKEWFDVKNRPQNKTKNVLLKFTLKEPIIFYRMTSSIIIEVALLELKLLAYQILNNG